MHFEEIILSMDYQLIYNASSNTTRHQRTNVYRMCTVCRNLYNFRTDVLRVKPVEGWKRGKAFVFYPERCISDGACIGVCPTKAIFWMRPMDFTVGQPVPLYKNSVFVKGWTELID